MIFRITVIVLLCHLLVQNASAAVTRCQNPPYVSCGECATTPWPVTNAVVFKIPADMKTVQMSHSSSSNTGNTKGYQVHYFDINETVYYRSKNANYTLEGGDVYSSVKCLPDGTWSTPPKCVAYCYGLPQIENGACGRSDYAGKVKLNDRVTCSCNSGFNLVGFTAVTCKLGNLWSEIPKCVAVTTIVTPKCAKAPVIRNGRCDSKTVYQTGEYVNCTCSVKDYVISSTRKPMCLGNNKWAFVPKCNFVTKNCSAPTDTPNAICDKCFLTTTAFKPGEKATYACLDGYYINGSRIIACQYDGTWTKKPTCDPMNKATCVNLPVLTNGKCTVDINTTNIYPVGKEITCVCNTGYQTNNSQYVYCLSTGNWSTRPTCTQTAKSLLSTVKCQPLTLTNGKCVAEREGVSNAADFATGEKIICSCNNNFNLTWSEQEQQAETTSGNAVTRLARTRRPKSAQRRRATTKKNGLKSVSKGATSKPPEIVVTCQAKGQWSHQPMCNRL